ncbi:MAG: hypothetical protein WAU21_03980 [Chitinophagales bacterium]
MDFLFEALWDIALTNPEGFTVSLQLEWPTSGYVVAYKETQNSFGENGLRKCLHHAIDHNGWIGGWKNQDGMLQFDSCMIVAEKEKAINLGNENKQIAIFCLDCFKEYYL